MGDATNTLLPSNLRSIVDKLCLQLGYENPRHLISAGSKPGENFLGVLIRTQVTSKSKPDLKPLYLIIKSPPKSAKRRDAMHADHIYFNEYTMYERVLPAFAQFLFQKRVISDAQYTNVPRVYWSNLSGDHDECLVMEDLSVRGFALADRNVGLNKEQCHLVLASLARLHSTSRAFEMHNPEEFGHLRAKLWDAITGKDSKILSELGKTAEKLIQSTGTRFPEDSIERTKIKHLLGNFETEISEVGKPSPDGFNVIIHGDCWTNNVMFKINQKTGATEDVCLLDWQLSRYCSPAVDLSYFFFLTTERSVRGDLSSLLKVYLDHYNQNIVALGYPNHSLSMDLLNEHMKRYGRLGVGFACCFLPFMLSDSSTVPDFDDIFEDGKEMSSIMDEWDCTKVANDRVSDIVEDAIKLGYL